MDVDAHHPENRIGRWFQARCSCGWKGRRRWLFKSYILDDYLIHHEDWPDHFRAF